MFTLKLKLLKLEHS